jgi:hypothetical protein
MLYRHFSNSRLSLEGGRGMPKLREGDRFFVDLVEADEVEMVRDPLVSNHFVRMWAASQARVRPEDAREASICC